MARGLPPSLWQLVHRLAAGEGWPPAAGEPANRFLWQAEREGLLPLLFEVQDLPAGIAAALEAHRALRRLYLRRSELLEQASRALEGLLEGEAVILLKGADYRRRLYARPEHRPMQDIDLLVRCERLNVVVDLLTEGGLESLPAGGPATRLASYHERVLRRGNVTIEVHHSFVQRVRHRVDYDAVWARRQPLDGGPRGWARLEDADALAYHALSLAIDEFSVPLIRYVDLWLMLESQPCALEAAAERARSWRSVRALHGALVQSFRLFPESRTEARASLARHLLPGPTRVFLRRCVLPSVGQHGRGKNMTRPVELWRKLWLLDGFGRRLAFAAYQLGACITGRRLARRTRPR
jgi:hypothetical protein